MFEICVMSINPECNKIRGPYNTIEEARAAALKWKGKEDRYGFDYLWVDIDNLKTGETVEEINLDEKE